MVKKQVPFQEPTPSAAPEDKALPVEPTQPPKAELEHRASPNSAVPYEILARDGTGYHSGTGALTSEGIRQEADDFGRAVSRILSAPKAFGGENHLSQQPVPGTRSALRNLERAAPGSPIWPCTRWGFPCLRAYAWSGGLLPHLFTLTPAPSPKPGRFDFLWHCPSGRLAASPPAFIPPRAFLRRPRQVTRHRALWCSDFPPPPDCSGESDPPPFQNQD